MEAHVAPAARRAPDEELVRRTLRGELDAFEVLVERHREVVYRVAARIVGEQEAEDVAQDALLRAFHRLGSFRGESPFRSWLLRTTHNTALNALARRRSVPVAQPVEEHDGPNGGDRSDATPAERLEVAERRARLNAKLGLLRPHYRAMIVLRELEGLSYEEIAAVTDTSLGTVKTRLHRARAELIELLRRNTYDWDLPR